MATLPTGLPNSRFEVLNDRSDGVCPGYLQVVRPKSRPEAAVVFLGARPKGAHRRGLRREQVGTPRVNGGDRRACPLMAATTCRSHTYCWPVRLEENRWELLASENKTGSSGATGGRLTRRINWLHCDSLVGKSFKSKNSSGAWQLEPTG